MVLKKSNFQQSIDIDCHDIYIVYVLTTGLEQGCDATTWLSCRRTLNCARPLLVCFKGPP